MIGRALLSAGAALLLALACSAATLTYEYDTLGRLKRVTDSGGQQITYTLDPAGNRTQVATAVNTAGTLSFSPATYAVTEGTASVTITVTRTGGSTGAVSVSYATNDGTALAGSDYTATTGTLNWAAADATSKNFTVTILNDAVGESAETFTVGLSNVSGGAALGTLSAVVTITDDDGTVPSVPANLRSSPTGTSFGGNYSILWDASTGSPSYYTLEESLDAGATWPNAYTVTAPSVAQAFSKGEVNMTFRYRVKACNASAQCSAYSSIINKRVCPTSGCP